MGQLGDGTFGYNAVVDLNDAVGIFLQAWVMGYYCYCLAFIGKGSELVHDHGQRIFVESRCGFVAEDELGVGD